MFTYYVIFNGLIGFHWMAIAQLIKLDYLGFPFFLYSFLKFLFIVDTITDAPHFPLFNHRRISYVASKASSQNSSVAWALSKAVYLILHSYYFFLESAPVSHTRFRFHKTPTHMSLVSTLSWTLSYPLIHCSMKLTLSLSLSIKQTICQNFF